MPPALGIREDAEPLEAWPRKTGEVNSLPVSTLMVGQGLPTSPIVRVF